MGTNNITVAGITDSASKTGKRLLRLKEAATYLGLSEWTIRQMAHGSELRFIQRESGSPMLFDINDLDEWIEKSKQ